MSRLRASSTAVLIVRALALLSRAPRFASIVPTDLAKANELMLGGTRGGAAFGEALRFPPVRALLRATERLLLPGIALHYLLRKRRLEEIVRASLGEGAGVGFGRVLVLGAGFDTLALRLHRDHPSVSFVEVDHPTTLALKRRVLEGCCEIGPNLLLLPAVLDARSLCRLFAGSRAEGDARRTLTVAEGLLMYLQPAVVERLLALLAQDPFAGARGGSRIAFTVMTATGADGVPRFPAASPLVDRWLRLRGEPFRWGCSEGDLAGWLRGQGWEPSRIEEAGDLRRRYLAPSRLDGEVLAEGEAIVVADAASVPPLVGVHQSE